MPDGEIRILCNRGADQKEGRRRDVCRHVDIGCDELAATLEADAVAAGLHLVTKTAQHALGVVARRCGFGHAGLAVRVKPREQDA